MFDSPQVAPKLDDKFLWELAETHKHDMDVMLRCCALVECEYWAAITPARNPKGGRAHAA